MRPAGRPRPRPIAKVLLIAGPLAIFAVLAREVRAGGTFGWDQAVLDWTSRLGQSEVVTVAMKALIASGGEYWKPLPIVLVTCAAASLWLARRRTDALFLVAAVVAAVVAAGLLKPEFPRPALRVGTDLFPSGHATGSMAVLVALAFATWSSRWRWPVVGIGTAFVFAFGLSLVFFRTHYPSDVVAGWCVALSCVAALRFGLERWVPRRQQIAASSRSSLSR
jgi:membrane-associated phospholipid phosphatase